jgi:hypothetical protein
MPETARKMRALPPGFSGTRPFGEIARPRYATQVPWQPLTEASAAWFFPETFITPSPVLNPPERERWLIDLRPRRRATDREISASLRRRLRQH